MSRKRMSRTALLLLLAALLSLSIAGLTDAMTSARQATASSSGVASGRAARLAARGPGRIAALAPATSSAIFADAAGQKSGVIGFSNGIFGVWGESVDGWGGYFHSDGGHGIRANTDSAEHYDHAGFFTANGGWGVLGRSTNNQGVRGEAGNLEGVSNPLGRVGAVGLGQNRGVHGASRDGVGVYGSSKSSYGGYFYSDQYRGIYARGDASQYAGYFAGGGSGSPGIYVNGTIVASGSKAGYVVDVGLNAGAEPLEVGDVVATVGAGAPILGEIPVMLVVKASARTAGAVVGVVDERFVPGGPGQQIVGGSWSRATRRGDESEGRERLARPAGNPVLAAGTGLLPGEYLSIVTLGSFKKVKVDAESTSIQPGDLLTPSPNPGFAMRALDPVAGTILGKALGVWEGGEGAVPVYVTLQ